MLFSFNPIGQLCLGVPGYSRRTEGSLYLVNSTKKVREREFRNVSETLKRWVKINSATFNPHLDSLVFFFFLLIPRWLGKRRCNSRGTGRLYLHSDRRNSDGS